MTLFFGPSMVPQGLKNGPFCDKKRVKSGSKTHFSKSDPGPFRMLKQVFLAHFEPVVTRFGPWKIPKCLENGPFWDQKWVKNGSKTCFSKNERGPFGVPKPGFCLPTRGGGGIQGPTHPEFWHTHRPTNVPPPPPPPPLTPTHVPLDWAWGRHSNCGVLALPPSHLTQMTMHPSPFMGVGHAHVICRAM